MLFFDTHIFISLLQILQKRWWKKQMGKTSELVLNVKYLLNVSGVRSAGEKYHVCNKDTNCFPLSPLSN